MRACWFLFGVLCVAVACRPVPSTVQDEAAIRGLVLAEGEAARTRDADRLEALWIEEGWVRDANHTPDDRADDRVWDGRDAFMARYSSVIFGLTLEEVGPIELDVDIQGARAVVTGTTRMGSERSPNGERWTFVRRQGAWQIESITFNLEARQP